MPWLLTPYTLLLFATAGLLLAVAAIIAPRRGVPGGMPLLLMMLAVAWWALMSGMEAATLSRGDKILYSKLAYLGTLPATPLLLTFTLAYRRQARWLRPPWLALLFAPALAIILLAWTNEAHGLIWSGFAPLPGNSRLLEYQHGPAFALAITYIYLCTALATLQLWLAYTRQRGPYRRQAGIMLLAAIFPWLGSLVYFSALNPWPGLDLIPVTFALTALLLAAGIWRMGLLDLAPIARDLLVESARDGMLALDTRRRLVDFNPAAQRLLSLPADALGQPLEQALAAQPQALAALQSADPEAEVRLEGDPPRHLSLQLTGLHSARGQPLGQLVTLSEITARRQMEDALRESEARYRSLIEQAPLPIAVLDIEGEHVLYANPRFAALFDTTPQNALQLHLPALYEDPADRLRLLAQLSRSGHVNGFEVCHKTLSGWHFWALVSAIQTTWCGMPAHLVFYFDITARRQLQHALEQKTRQLERLAITDGLTGLYNRRYADQVLEREFARAARYRRPLCLALLDLDNLKEINARCGHAGGDQALQSLARLLQDHTRVSDTAARIGGDEFLIILPHIGLEKACQAVERLRSALAGTPPIQDGGPALSVSAGIVAWHAGENPAQALLRADRLLYQAKEAGRNQVRHETPEAAPEPAAHPEAG